MFKSIIVAPSRQHFIQYECVSQTIDRKLLAALRVHPIWTNHWLVTTPIWTLVGTSDDVSNQPVESYWQHHDGNILPVANFWQHLALPFAFPTEMSLSLDKFQTILLSAHHAGHMLDFTSWRTGVAANLS